jgi:hypothetical protein
MDIQPGLQHGGGDEDSSNSHSHYELAVFDDCPPTQDCSKITATTTIATSDVVLLTGKIVGSIAPGMTVQSFLQTTEWSRTRIQATGLGLHEQSRAQQKSWRMLLLTRCI